MVVAAWCLSLGGFPVLHFDLSSPQIYGHHGVFFKTDLNLPRALCEFLI